MTTPDPSRLLLVAYDFPPIDSAGMQRIVSMAKYLSRQGWAVTVITVRSSFVPRISESSLDSIPENVEVVRTACFEVRQLMVKLNRWAYGGDADAFGPAGAGSGVRGRMIRPLIKLLSAIDGWTGYPDKKVGWSLPLYLTLRRLVRRDGSDVVLSSSPPHSSHLPVLWLRRHRRFRWVVDFRDPWSTPLEGRRMSRKLRRYRRLEGRILNAADAIVANTPGNKTAIHETFPEIPADKVVVVTNGFDDERRPTRLNGSGPSITGDFVYTGFVYPGMLDTYVDAIRYLLDCGKEPPRLQVFGPRPADLPEDPVLMRYIDIHESVPFEECLEIMRRSRALLLLVPYERETCVPSKLYPYLFSSTPVLALGPSGDAADIIESTGVGRVVCSRDPGEVAGAIESFLADVAGAGSDRNDRSDIIANYAWNHLGSRLDGVLHATTAA